MSSSKVYVCRRCHLPRHADELLEMTHVRDGHRSFLCRPSPARHCFADDAYAASEERIAAVDDDEPGDAA